MVIRSASPRACRHAFMWMCFNDFPVSTGRLSGKRVKHFGRKMHTHTDRVGRKVEIRTARVSELTKNGMVTGSERKRRRWNKKGKKWINKGEAFRFYVCILNILCLTYFKLPLHHCPLFNSHPECTDQLWERLTRGSAFSSPSFPPFFPHSSLPVHYPLPPFFGGVSINIWRSRAALWQQLIRSPALCLLSPSLFPLSLSSALCLCLPLSKSDCSARRCWQAHCGLSSQKEEPLDILPGLSRRPWQHFVSLYRWISVVEDFHFSFFGHWVPGADLQHLICYLGTHPPPSPHKRSSSTCVLVEGENLRLWDDGDSGVGCKLELSVRAPGAALLHRPEPAQSVQPAADPCAQEAHQHRGQAMGPRPQQVAQTKGLWLTYAHTSHPYTSCFLSFIFPHSHLFFFIYRVSFPSVSLLCSVNPSACACALSPWPFLSAQSGLLFLSDGSIDSGRGSDALNMKIKAKLQPAVKPNLKKTILAVFICFYLILLTGMDTVKLCIELTSHDSHQKCWGPIFIQVNILLLVIRGGNLYSLCLITVFSFIMSPSTSYFGQQKCFSGRLAPSAVDFRSHYMI